MARQPVVLQVLEGRQVVQEDRLAASGEPHFREMLELYGGSCADRHSVVEDAAAGIVSLHQLGGRGTGETRSRPRASGARVGELL
jgi:hypothetical protein